MKREKAPPKLGVFLNKLEARYHRRDLLSSDPLEFVYHFRDPLDQEVVAIISALMAYGKVAQIRKSVSEILARMQKSAGCPKAFVLQLKKPSKQREAFVLFHDFVHRFNTGNDIVILLQLVQQSWERFGSVGDHFLSFFDAEDPHIENALSKLITYWKDQSHTFLVKPHTSFYYLLNSPKDGSCCKRWCMLLRWMGRKDQVDPGLWAPGSSLSATFRNLPHLKPKHLVMPLDTHTGRICQYLGLTERKSLNWQAALEITQALKKLDPDDPTRYDFAISRLGILSICQRRFREEICTQCQLLPVCRFAQQSSHQLSQSMEF